MLTIDFTNTQENDAVRLFLLAALSVSALGCREPERPGQAAAEIAEFRLTEEPIVSIGVVEGGKAYQLFRVRSAFQLRNGTVVVANNGTSELRFYDQLGQHLRTVGRQGQGPGEFENLRYAGALRGDTIATWDIGQRRVSYFDSDGDLVHDFTVDLTDHVVQVGAWSIPAHPVEMVAQEDGLLLFQAAAPMRMLSGLRPDGTYDPGSVAPDGVYRVAFSLFSVDRSGSVVRTLGPVPADEWFLSGGIWQYQFFGHRFYMAGGREMFVVGSGKPYAFRVTSGHDDFRLVETGIPERAIPVDVWQQRLERAILSSFPPARIARVRAMPRPETMPAYSALLVDDEDRVWVQEFDADRSTRVVSYIVGVAPDPSSESAQPQRWSIFDSDGLRIGSIELPPNVRITHISRGRVTVVVQDELGVERVQVFSLARSR